MATAEGHISFWTQFYRHWHIFTIFINALLHIYLYVVHHIWRYSIGANLLGECVSFAFFYLALSALMLMRDHTQRKSRVSWCLLALSVFPPFVFVVWYTQRSRALFYKLIWFNVFVFGLIIFSIICANLDSLSDPLDPPLVILYFVIYFLAILSLYPLFQPLHAINLKMLTLKICTFALQIISVLFTAFILIVHYWGPRSHPIHDPLLQTIYKLYATKLLIITPLISVWSVLYALRSRFAYYVQMNAQSAVSCIAFSLMLSFVILTSAVIFALHYCFVFELFSGSILESLVLFYSDNTCYIERESNQTSDLFRPFAWSVVHRYLTNIDDSIGYQQRLQILYVLLPKAGSCDDGKTLREHLKPLEDIIMRRDSADSCSDHCRKKSVFTWLLQNFLLYIKMHAKRYKDLLTMVHVTKSTKLLQFYDFDEGRFRFQWCSWRLFRAILEFVGVFLIMPLFVLCTFMTSIACPLYLIFAYFYFSGVHVYDYALWLIVVYLVLLAVIVALWMEQWKLVKMARDLQCVDMERLQRWLELGPSDQIELYHDYLVEYRMIYDILNKFFASLSPFVMRYIGMIDEDGILQFSPLRRCVKLRHNSRRAVRDESKQLLEFDYYLFEVVSDSVSCEP